MATPRSEKIRRAISNSQRVKHRREARARAAKQVSVAPLPTLGDLTCWCGRECGHDWPGKADGSSHPR